MFYIVGLGNPGEQYARTRHNVGWLLLDAFIEKQHLANPVSSAACSGRVTGGVVAGAEISVLYPDTFMNNSGSAVAKFVPKADIERLIIIHDDIDLAFGEIKIAKGRGAGGNNGVQSVISKLGSKAFTRIRVGIAPKSFWTGKTKRPAGGGPLERFVLKSFSGAEAKQLPHLAAQVDDVITTIISDGVEVAMNKFN